MNPKNNTPIQFNFYPKEVTLLLGVGRENISSEAKKMEAEKLWLLRKNEFHFTIIRRQTGEEILEKIQKWDEKQTQKILQKIKKLGENIEWKVELKNEYYYVKKDYKNLETPDILESIIQIAEIKWIEAFYKQLNILLDTQFEIPLPHVTLYTNSIRKEKERYGIGIYSLKQFEKLSPKKI